MEESENCGVEVGEWQERVENGRDWGKVLGIECGMWNLGVFSMWVWGFRPFFSSSLPCIYSFLLSPSFSSSFSSSADRLIIT